MKIAKWLTAVLLVSCGSLTSAGIIIDIDESGSDVVATFNGSIDLNAVTFQFSPVGNTPGVSPSLGVISFASGDEQYVLNLISSDGTWGSGVTTLADSSSGDGFVFSPNALSLPAGYVSGSGIAGLITFLTEDFTTMGFTAGVYNYTFGQVGVATDFVTVSIGKAQIPAPATIALFALGLGALGYRRRKRA